MAAFDENDCCGNGCINCVLDVKPLKNQAQKFKKFNIINEYCNFTLQSITPFGEVNEVVELHFTSCLCPSESSILDVPSGKHIMMRAPLNECNGKRILRPYSPFWLDKEKLEFKILVNLTPSGPMSRYISTLSTGDKVEFRGPIGGQYIHTSTDNKHLVLISQGVAIAPTLPIVREILENEDDMTRIFQFACFSDLTHAYFRKELQEFNKFWNYSGCLYLSRQICENIECANNKLCTPNCKRLAQKLFYKEKVFAKRLDGMELLKTIGEDAFKTAMFVISGSRRFQEQISNDLVSLGFNASDKNLFLL